VPKTQFYTATTIDGFIADEHNSLDWLFEVPQGEDDGSWDEFIADVAVLVMGATTYEWVLDHEDLVAHPEKWHQFYGDRPAWVFSHRDLPAIPGVDLHFVSGDVGDAYDEIAAAASDGNIWVVGGGDLVGQFDDAGHLDEIQLGAVPVVLGAGAPLLPRRITASRLHLRSARQSGQQVRIVLDVARPQT
jgi:dihydrofolate reductase